MVRNMTSFRFMSLAGRFATISLLLFAAGCVRYTRAPINSNDVLNARANLALNAATLEKTVLSIAPRAMPSGKKLDRLSLFAAILILDPKVESARAATATAKAQARASRNAQGTTLTLISEYANDPATRSPWLLGGTIDIPIDTGGRRKARLTTADIAVLVANYDFAETLWAERMSIRRAFADRMIAQRQATLAAQVTELRNRQLAVMERRFRAGAAARSELIQVQLAQASASRLADDGVARAMQAEHSITATLGLPETGLSAFDLFWDGFDVPHSDPLLALPTDARDQALIARSNILKSLAAYDQAESDLRAEVSRQFPAIIVSPGYTWERGLVKLPLSLGLALPPLDFNRSAIAAAQAKRNQAGQKIEAEIAQAAGAFEASIAERRQAFAILQKIRAVDIPSARRLAAQADAELQHGSIDRAEWAIAHIAVLQYQLSELDALARVHAADAALEDAVQRPLEGPEQMIENMLVLARS